MGFQKYDNVIIDFGGDTKYAGVVDSSKGDDANNPTEYTVIAKKYWGLNSQGKKAWIDKSEESFTVPASLVKANPSRSGTGFVQGS